jgi:hypothetical protein
LWWGEVLHGDNDRLFNFWLNKKLIETRENESSLLYSELRNKINNR